MVPDSDTDANDTLIDYYKENLISEYSKSIVDQSGSNSLAQQLYEQMKRNYGITDITEETESVNATEAASAASTTDTTADTTAAEDNSDTDEVTAVTTED